MSIETRSPETEIAKTQSVESETSKTELVRGVEAGDPTAEELLVRRYSPGLRAILMRHGADPSLADDLRQETLALALTKIRGGELRQPEALTGFLRSLAKNLLIGHRRREARYGELSAEEAESRGAEASQLRSLLAGEEARQVRQLLDELRHPRDREVLMRYYLGDDPAHEICRDLEVAPDLFNRVLYRARQRLRQLWERSVKRQELWRTSS